MKNLSATILGAAATPLLGGASFGQSGQGLKVEHRTLGKTKMTSVSMGVMNCSDPAVLQRALELGINFYDTADCYMGGRNEEMVGKAFEGKRPQVFLQTKVDDGDEKKMKGLCGEKPSQATDRLYRRSHLA